MSFHPRIPNACVSRRCVEASRIDGHVIVLLQISRSAQPLARDKHLGELIHSPNLMQHAAEAFCVPGSRLVELAEK